jgi:serine/threonine protein kinase
LVVTGKQLVFRKGEKITDNYEIGDMYSDSYYRKARVGIHKKTGLERAIIQKEKSDYPNLDAFIKKVDFMNSFDHPNIVRYLEAYEDVNFYFIVCECLKGNDIIDTVYYRGKYSEEYGANLLK